jgi:hypothetical protein
MYMFNQFFFFSAGTKILLTLLINMIEISGFFLCTLSCKGHT